MQIEERVRELVEEKIADRADLFIVRIKMHNNGILEILMDGDDGIAIEDCVQISRHVGFHLEEENAIDRAYRLEVSSPGIDTPLLLHRQYQKNIGRMVRVKGLEGDKREGKLIAVNDKSITIEEIKKEKGKKAVPQEAEIPLDNITETKVLISFK
ncbi:ribosome assembly cofactor RimP [Sphingobacterium sp. FBM7-1]|uniref:ribosome assembly cofactor RimP n=1 Tax=Sphingobacterium sp. FBM7-1 TaxID=2886688 RepID=UPI001D12F5E5|nr:ribosome assembly cofactor RimP [Sphingobacterium sp. FBM7-1]MCC2600681.1 ribosome assembly cofactor RimP [Sphingobacterium sp. FBM7-1]